MFRFVWGVLRHPVAAYGFFCSIWGLQRLKQEKKLPHYWFRGPGH